MEVFSTKSRKLGLAEQVEFRPARKEFAAMPRQRGLNPNLNRKRLSHPMGEGRGEGIRDTELNGHPTERLAKTTNITFHGIESEALLILLDQAGVCASAGSACLADSDEPSHVVKAMKPAGNAARQMIRFSLGWESTAADVQGALLTR